MVSYDGEQHKVADKGNNGDDESDQGNQGGEERSENASAQTQKECDERNTTSNGVQDHHAGQTGGRIAIGLREGSVFDRGHNIGGGVANPVRGAVIMVVVAVHGLVYEVLVMSEFRRLTPCR